MILDLVKSGRPNENSQQLMRQKYFVKHLMCIEPKNDDKADFWWAKLSSPHHPKLYSYRIFQWLTMITKAPKL